MNSYVIPSADKSAMTSYYTALCYPSKYFYRLNSQPSQHNVCGTLKCENAAICEKVAKCEKYSTLNVKIYAICEKITLNVKKMVSDAKSVTVNNSLRKYTRTSLSNNKKNDTLFICV